MNSPFEELAGLDRLVHDPSRLSILTALAACEGADFVFLRRLTGLTDGNLSAHLSKLERARLVTIEKDFVGKTPRTLLRITEEGRRTIDEHWARLEGLKAQAERWRDEKPEPAKPEG